jgi:hypothetical protein
MIQDLFHSDNAKVNAALDALFHGLDNENDKKKGDKIQAVGGCFALVHLMQNCLDKAVDRISACDQVTDLNELAELTTLHKTFAVIVALIFCHDESKIGIAAIGGVEAVVKVMKTFPKCQVLQRRACYVLSHLVCCSICKAKDIETDGIEVLLAVVSNNLGSWALCRIACRAMHSILSDSKENTGLFISLGGATAVAQVRTQWADDRGLQQMVNDLTALIIAEMNNWMR